jgi:hypothetical protein
LSIILYRSHRGECLWVNWVLVDTVYHIFCFMWSLLFLNSSFLYFICIFLELRYTVSVIWCWQVSWWKSFTALPKQKSPKRSSWGIFSTIFRGWSRSRAELSKRRIRC